MALLSLQIGVAQLVGTDVGVHVVRPWFQRDQADEVATEIDFGIAFNTVDRITLLEQCRLHFPALSPWLGWCYFEPTLKDTYALQPCRPRLGGATLSRCSRRWLSLKTLTLLLAWT